MSAGCLWDTQCPACLMQQTAYAITSLCNTSLQLSHQARLCAGQSEEPRQSLCDHARAAPRLVFPLSTWPSNPMLTLCTRALAPALSSIACCNRHA